MHVCGHNEHGLNDMQSHMYSNEVHVMYSNEVHVMYSNDVHVMYSNVT